MMSCRKLAIESAETQEASRGGTWAKVGDLVNRATVSRRLKLLRFWKKASGSPERISSSAEASPVSRNITRPSTTTSSSISPGCADIMRISKDRAAERRGYFDRLIEYCGCFVTSGISGLLRFMMTMIPASRLRLAGPPGAVLGIRRPWRPYRRGRRRGKRPKEPEKLLGLSRLFGRGGFVRPGLIGERRFTVENGSPNGFSAEICEAFVRQQMRSEVGIDIELADGDLQINRLSNEIRPVLVRALNSAQGRECLFRQRDQDALSEFFRSSHSVRVSRFVERHQIRIPQSHNSCLLLAFRAIGIALQAVALAVPLDGLGNR